MSSYWFAVTTTSALVVMFLAIITDIFMRTIGQPVLGIPEFSSLLMIVIVYGGLAYCQSKDAHISVDWLVKLSNQKTQAVLRIVVFVIILGFLTIALWATLERFLIALEVNEKYEGLAFMPMWPARLMLLLGVFWFWVQIFVDALRSISKVKPVQ